MKSTVDKIVDVLRANQIDQARKLLRTYIAADPSAALADIKQKELLLNPSVMSARARFRDDIASAFERTSGTLLQQSLNYLEYCDVIGPIRDELAARAQNEAVLLAALPPEIYVELCVMAVVALVRRYIAKARRPAPSSVPRVPVELAGGIWEISGRYAVLPFMLTAVCSCRPGPEDRRPLSLMDAMRAAQRLCTVAEDWQALLNVRQGVACVTEVVSRVEPSGRIMLDPTSPEEQRRLIANKRRLALVNVVPTKPYEYLRESFMPALKSLSRFAVAITRSDKDPLELAEQQLRLLGASITPASSVLLRLVSESGEASDSARVLLCMYLLTSLISKARPVRLSRGEGYMYRWCAEGLFQFISDITEMPIDFVRRVASLCSWNLLTQGTRPYDSHSKPYVMLSDDTIGLIVLPGVTGDAINETRRVLASTNKLSAVVGAFYEEFVRNILRDAGFDVVSGSVKLKEGGQTATDVDALACKDGVVVVAQAKHMVEPDSHHGIWKARHEILSGVRQCVIARNWLRDRPSYLSRCFPRLRGMESDVQIFGMVVCPSLRFTGALHGDIAVVDDAYLDHVVRVKTESTHEIGTGKVVSSAKLYDGDQPSAEDFVALMKEPSYLNRYVRDPWALIYAERRIGDVVFAELDARDSLSREATRTETVERLDSVQPKIAPDAASRRG
ncbi:MAG: hypothetical protein U0359_16700 [Byssovorax sp.]